MGDTATALRLLRAHLAAASALVDAMEPSAQPEVPAPPDEDPEIACPNCGEKRDEKLEDSTHADDGGRLVPRVTCLSCGKSFNPKPEEVARG